jgi:ferritin-like protein
MGASSATFHEKLESLSESTVELHRAYASLQEELEAIDWYQQRVDATRDPELRQVLEHNRDEEKEHAMMVLEWIRRRDPVLSRMISLYVGRSGPIVTEASKAEASGSADLEGRKT